MNGLPDPRNRRTNQWLQRLWVRWTLGAFVVSLAGFLAVWIWAQVGSSYPWQSTPGRLFSVVAGLPMAIIFAVGFVRMLQREDGLGGWVGAFSTLLAFEVGVDGSWAGITGTPISQTAFGQILGYAQLLFWEFVIVMAALRLVLRFNWAPLGVARTMLTEAMRMKIAMVFVVGLLLILPWLPFLIDPSEPVRYRVQTFLSFSLMATTVLLGLMTIFLSCSTLSTEIAQKQIHTIVAKPVGRGAFLFGKWLGIGLLNLALLAVAGGAIYGFVMVYLVPQSEREVRDEFAIALDRMDSTSPDRALAVRHEITGKALHEQLSIWCDEEWEIALTKRISDLDERIEQLREIGSRPLLERIQPLPTRYDELKSAIYEWQLLHEGVLTARHSVDLMAPADLLRQAEERFEQIRREDPGMIEQLGAEEVWDQLKNRVEYMWLNIPQNESRNYQFRNLQQAKRNNDYIQLRFKVFADKPIGENNVRFEILANGRLIPVSTPPDEYRTRHIPTSAIDENGVLILTFRNFYYDESGGLQTLPSEISFPYTKGMQVLYRVGGFEMNFLRSLCIIWLRLAFLAMLGLTAATFLGFPIASLLSLLVFCAAMASSFIVEAAASYNSPGETNPVAIGVETSLRVIGRSFAQVLNQYAKVSPIEQVSSGLAVSWSQVYRAMGWILLVWTGVVGVIGWIVFSRRELARVQV
ncbi:MAG: hypothetical protein CMJ49_04715 [Planctomycetaceae bacterium]|nr:hypothetical protein [Planctomycetaceae bacterium]